MAITRLQQTSGQSGGYVQTATIAYTSNVTAGSLLILVAAGGVDTGAISDNNTNTWNIALRATVGTARQCTIGYVFNAHAGATTITWTTTNFADSAFIIAEYSGILSASNPFDQSGSNNLTGTSFTATAAGNTAQANELVILGLAIDSQSATITGDATFTTLITQLSSAAQFTQAGFQDKVLSAIATPAGTMTTNTSQQGAIALATFKDSGGASAAVVPVSTLAFLGAG